MEASNSPAFLPLLTVLELLGLKISWFRIRVRETDVTTKLGVPHLALDHVLTAWMAGLINLVSLVLDMYRTCPGLVPTVPGLGQNIVFMGT